MADAWSGRAVPLLLDDRARSTYGNALAAAGAARVLGVREVVLVTSRWHRRRAATLVRAALRGSTTRVRGATTDERGTLPVRLREVACWFFVPFQAALAGTVGQQRYSTRSVVRDFSVPSNTTRPSRRILKG
jgi:hypothetical protein